MTSFYQVDPSVAEAYDRDGVVLLRNIIPEAPAIGRLHEAVERILAEEKEGARNYFKRLRMWERDPEFRAVLFESAVPIAAAQLLRTEKVNLLYDQLFVKEPGSNFPTPWHNDHPYWPVRGNQVVTLWIALDKVTLANGGLEFVRGSHKQSKWYRPFSTDLSGDIVGQYQEGDVQFEDVPDIERNRDKFDVVSYDLNPGDAIAFHSLTLHGAPGNTQSHARRRALSIRMAGSDVVYYEGPVWNDDITNKTLKAGDPLDSEQYPVLYRARA